MNTQQKEAAPVKDRWNPSQKRAAHIAAKREEARSKMAYSANNSVGLPPEAFDDFLDSGGLTVGVNYLRTLKHTKLVGSEVVNLYGNLMVKKRPSTTHVHTSHTPHNPHPQDGVTHHPLHQGCASLTVRVACYRRVPQLYPPCVTTATLWGILLIRCRQRNLLLHCGRLQDQVHQM